MPEPAQRKIKPVVINWPCESASVAYTRLASKVMRERGWKYPNDLDKLRAEMSNRTPEWCVSECYECTEPATANGRLCVRCYVRNKL